MKINPWIKHPRAAATITKTDSDYQLLTTNGIRKPTITRITSFPDEMMFTGPYSVQWERIGNSVPPLFMHAIAEHVRREILDAENA